MSKIRDLIENHNRGYDPSIYGTVKEAAIQKDKDFDELITLVENRSEKCSRSDAVVFLFDLTPFATEMLRKDNPGTYEFLLNAMIEFKNKEYAD